LEKYDLLEPDQFYHIYNQGNNGINLFLNAGNYLFFLQRFEKYIVPVAHIYAYALMPNHFHFLVQIKSNCNEKIASQAFGNLFNSYAKAFNKQQKRSGSLFRRKFRRKKIENQQYLNNTLIYIHNNPVNHGYCDDSIEYSWTSYHDYLSNESTFINKEVALKWFDGVEEFKEAHY
jgi:REP element-mobilizing transposase RayT